MLLFITSHIKKHNNITIIISCIKKIISSFDLYSLYYFILNLFVFPYFITLIIFIHVI